MSASLPVKKKPRKAIEATDVTSRATLFRTGEEIRKALNDQSPETLKTSVQSLRNQLTLHDHELPISSNDERLLLAQQWLDQSPGASEIFNIWESSSQNAALSALCVSTLACLLTLLSTHYIYHPLADPIIRQLHELHCMRRLSTNLTASQHELVLVTLKLFNGLVAFADGREKRAVMDGFAWGMKSLPKLFNMRRKGPRAKGKEAFTKPDIRTLFIQFILSFTTSSTPTPIKTAMLEDHKDLFIGIFKGLQDDSYDVVRYILEISWDGIWCDTKLARTTKIRLFSEGTLSHLTKLYARSDPEGEDQEDIPADLVHHFLLAITTRPGTGMCFHDRGWYPRISDQENIREDLDLAEDSPNSNPSGAIYNKILRNFLKTLKINEDAREQELALKILAACPELVQGYWSTASISFEPRLSSRWITNVAFLGSVIALAIPTKSFATWDPKLPSSSSTTTPTSYLPVPPPLNSIIENIIPFTFSKEHLSKGLLSFKEPLVVHCTALALAKMLIKYEAVCNTFKSIEIALEESVESGQWYKRRLELEKQLRRRMPEFQVIVAMSQKFAVTNTHGYNLPADSSVDADSTAMDVDAAPGIDIQRSMLNETALRVMWLYHKLLPSLVAETRFDAGKLLNALPISSPSNGDGSQAAGLDALGQLHVLRLLQESSQFAWTAKHGASQHSQLHQILTLAVENRRSPVGDAATSLAVTLLSRSVVFEHDAHEPMIWLDALPILKRSPSAKAPDNTPLKDEPTATVSFLNECILRCIKTPYHYLERVLELCYGPQQGSHLSGTGEGDADRGVRSPHSAPSPLLATFFEQLSAKHSKGLLPPSDVLALIAYLRRVVICLIGKLEDVTAGVRLLQAFYSLIMGVSVPLDQISIATAVARELRLVARALHALSGDSKRVIVKVSKTAVSDATVSAFIDALEKFPSDHPSHTDSPAELIDWVRLVDPPLNPDNLTRIVSLLAKWAPDQDYFYELVMLLEPTEARLSNINASGGLSGALARRPGIGWIIFIYGPRDLQDAILRTLLVDVLIRPSDEAAVIPTLRLLLPLIAPPSRPGTQEEVNSLFLFLADLMGQVKSSSVLEQIKRLLFIESPVMKELLFEDRFVSSGYLQLIRLSLDANLPLDHSLALAYHERWSTRIHELNAALDQDSKLLAVAAWLPFFHEATLEHILDGVINFAKSKTAGSHSANMTIFLSELSSVVRLNASRALVASSRLPSLLIVADQLDSPSFTAMLESLAAASIPLGINRRLRDSGDSSASGSLRELVVQASSRWRSRTVKLSGNLDDIFQTRKPTALYSKITAALLYSPSPSEVDDASIIMLEALSSDDGYPAILPALQAILDTSLDSDGFQIKTIEALIPKLIQSITSKSRPDVERQRATFCLLSASKRSNVRQIVTSQVIAVVRSLPFHHFFRPRLQQFFLKLLLEQNSLDSPQILLEALIDRGLHLAVRQFASLEAESPKDLEGLTVFVQLVKQCSEIKPHLAEPVFTAGISHRIEIPAVLRLLSALCQHVKMKPIDSNRLLQTLLQHNSFLPAARPSSPSTSSSATRSPLIDLIYSLFMMNPTNASHPSHIIPLAKIYAGTLHRSDVQLRSIFEGFEGLRLLSTTPLFQHWSANSLGTSNTLLDALISLDPSTVVKTYTRFPPSTSLHSPEITASLGSTLYDPRFLLSLLAGVLVSEGSSGLSHMDWVNLFRTNVVSVALRALASKEDDLRETAAQSLFLLGNTLRDADFQEHDEVLLVLTLARDAVPGLAAKPDVDGPITARLSTVHALLLAHALRGTFYPSNTMYPLMMQFLLQRPEIDTKDLPMLFASLYSTSDEWRQERWWIIHFIADSMASSQDWRILTRRHVWDLLATMFQESSGDKALRRGILEVLIKITNHPRAAMGLVIRSSLLSWIELQLQDLRPDEFESWLQVLANVAVNIDHAKCDIATTSSWRRSMLACVDVMLRSTGSSIRHFHTICCILRRLAETTSETYVHAEMVSSLSTGLGLDRFEEELEFSDDLLENVALLEACEPASSRKLDPGPDTPALLLWGHCVEMLWEIVMKSDVQTNPALSSAWNSLTSRLLLWNAISGNSVVGEWARVETIRQMRS